ncbi:hypothetical protein C8R46DRAFT_621425 [Mycena filopes]|nr:hypothetical protein C8R46DRAFT_621425 [Mycena filopes]
MVRDSHPATMEATFSVHHKQLPSCYFCRKRKIACRRPDGWKDGEPCTQCTRRQLECSYPTVSRRGQRPDKKTANKSVPESIPEERPTRRTESENKNSVSNLIS